MAGRASFVVTVEIDEHLFQMAREELEDCENVLMLHQDALKNKNRIDPRVWSAVRDQLGRGPGLRFKLAANLPFNIATPIISNMLRGELVPETMTVTIQKELADRIIAAPNSKDYGALSVWVQSLCEPKLVRVLSPSVFWPRPKVESAIIHLVHRPDWRAQFADLEFFHRFVRSIFFHRRKFLRSVAISAFKDRLTKPQVDEVLSAQKLSQEARTEQLSVQEIQRLGEAFRLKLNEVA
jgi:16S rRNA (adenine1518-N6/adenine1519-N6)-dimethyltransferase